MKGISVPDLVWLNAAAVGETGGATGVRDASALEAAVARPCAGYGGEELFPFDKAAALMEPVIQRHPFVDGNKRTGLLAGAALLYLAGYGFAAPRDEMVEVPVMMAEQKITLEELSRWFEKHARQQGKRG
ncbi:type II toxin-antitoxin system death-on-curing family toxin [soil metagenome]